MSKIAVRSPTLGPRRAHARPTMGPRSPALALTSLQRRAAEFTMEPETKKIKVDPEAHDSPEKAASQSPETSPAPTTHVTANSPKPAVEAPAEETPAQPEPAETEKAETAVAETATSATPRSQSPAQSSHTPTSAPTPSNAAPTPTPANPKQEIEKVLSELFPNRKHLGSVVYNPTTTWLTLQTSHLTGLKDEDFERFEEIREQYIEKAKDSYYQPKYIPVIPPLPTDYINHLLEIKIPVKFIKKFLDETDGSREIWGGQYGIYTDDSDILTILLHQGFFDDKIDLTPWNKDWEPSDIVYPMVNKDNDIKGDLAVTVLLLPTLRHYDSVYREGVNSRSWTSVRKHSGLSIAVYNVKWEIEGAYMMDKTFFKRYQTELSYDAKYLKRDFHFDAKCFRALKAKYTPSDSVE